jgi:hypothetical protein
VSACKAPGIARSAAAVVIVSNFFMIGTFLPKIMLTFTGQEKKVKTAGAALRAWKSGYPFHIGARLARCALLVYRGKARIFAIGEIPDRRNEILRISRPVLNGA